MSVNPTESQSSLQLQQVRLSGSDDAEIVEAPDLRQLGVQVVHLILGGDHHELGTLC